ncbi:MAG TPA: DUF4197 domain-containing protein [Acidobacteriota bacterium]|nr:DUF4197 domain-containing protein [Acidobacteriota bacterium]
MKALRILFVLAVMTLSICQTPFSYAGFGDIVKGLQKAVGVGGGLSEDKIIDGLKEALQIGTGNAVETVSRLGGYYENPQIKIPLPGALQKAGKLLRAVGYGSQLDAFEMSMNHAAEKAAPQAKSIFLDAIKGMNVTDAGKILNGRENEATLYFKEKTWDPLSKIFKPIIHNSMSEVGATQKYQELEEKVRSMPFGGSLKIDLDQHVNNGALDGLFFMLAEEEKKIRQNPAARVTDLLKEVFGKK